MKTAAPLAQKPDAAPHSGGARKACGARAHWRGEVRAGRRIFCRGAVGSRAERDAAKRVSSRSQRRERPDPLLWLNDAFATNGLQVSVNEGAEIDKPVEIVHCAASEGASALYSQVSAMVEHGRSHIVPRELLRRRRRLPAQRRRRDPHRRSCALRFCERRRRSS